MSTSIDALTKRMSQAESDLQALKKRLSTMEGIIAEKGSFSMKEAGGAAATSAIVSMLAARMRS